MWPPRVITPWPTSLTAAPIVSPIHSPAATRRRTVITATVMFVTCRRPNVRFGTRIARRTTRIVAGGRSVNGSSVWEWRPHWLRPQQQLRLLQPPRQLPLLLQCLATSSVVAPGHVLPVDLPDQHQMPSFRCGSFFKWSRQSIPWKCPPQLDRALPLLSGIIRSRVLPSWSTSRELLRKTTKRCEVVGLLTRLVWER